MNDRRQTTSDHRPLLDDLVALPLRPAPAEQTFSDYIVYVDESGDHSLVAIDDAYPVFVLSFCIFQKRYYGQQVVPALEAFKFVHFGHDIVILHERDIRKETGDFRFSSANERLGFIDALSRIIETSKFIPVASVIDKRRMRATEDAIGNPYHVALRFCLEQLREFLAEKGQLDGATHVVVECRGKKEDADLELEFRRICDGANRFSASLPFSIVFADKKANSSGLQLADLVARPIGLSVVRPTQINRAFDILKEKFFCRGGRANVGRNYEGMGYMIYPEA